MTTFPTSRSHAEDCDTADPLGGFRECVALDDPSLIYLDGNSLGMLPLATRQIVNSDYQALSPKPARVT